jgi:hypothetical protein
MDQEHEAVLYQVDDYLKMLDQRWFNSGKVENLLKAREVRELRTRYCAALEEMSLEAERDRRAAFAKAHQ